MTKISCWIMGFMLVAGFTWYQVIPKSVRELTITTTAPVPPGNVLMNNGTDWISRPAPPELPVDPETGKFVEWKR